MSSTRARFVSDSVSCSSALRRRRSCRRTPATSSNSGRRSSGRSASAWSTMPWPMNRNALSARWARVEQVDEVAEPDPLLVQEVVVLAAAVEPPAELQDRVVDRQQAVGVVEDERHVGHAERRALLGAREDHVLGLAAAEGAALLAERPAERVGEVALARAVRPDDRADPGSELDDRPLGERLEPLEPEGEEPGRRGHRRRRAAAGDRRRGRRRVAAPVGRARPVCASGSSRRPQRGSQDLGRGPPSPARRPGLGDPARRPGPDAERPAVDDDLDLELLLVVRPGRSRRRGTPAASRSGAG